MDDFDFQIEILMKCSSRDLNPNLRLRRPIFFHYTTRANLIFNHQHYTNKNETKCFILKYQYRCNYGVNKT